MYTHMQFVNITAVCSLIFCYSFKFIMNFLVLSQR